MTAGMRALVVKDQHSMTGNAVYFINNYIIKDEPFDLFAGLVLNSPWLDLHGPAVLRTAFTSAAVGAMSRVRKTWVLRGTVTGAC